MSIRGVEIETAMNGKLTHIVIGSSFLWFSYTTLIAFGVAGQPRVVCENVWSSTTGKHLNYIDGGSREAKDARMDYDEFNRRASRLVVTIEQDADLLQLAQTNSHKENDGEPNQVDSPRTEPSDDPGGLGVDGRERHELAGPDVHPERVDGSGDTGHQS